MLVRRLIQNGIQPGERRRSSLATGIHRAVRARGKAELAYAIHCPKPFDDDHDAYDATKLVQIWSDGEWITPVEATGRIPLLVREGRPEGRMAGASKRVGGTRV